MIAELIHHAIMQPTCMVLNGFLFSCFLDVDEIDIIITLLKLTNTHA